MSNTTAGQKPDETFMEANERRGREILERQVNYDLTVGGMRRMLEGYPDDTPIDRPLFGTGFKIVFTKEKEVSGIDCHC